MLPDRFWAKVDKSAGDSGCWPWTAWAKGGYGRFWTGAREVPAHRVAYELLVGPIPDGLEIDHLCRNHGCCNPLHLEPVTHAENTKRGSGFAAVLSTRTHCPQGHPYDEANTYTWSRRGCTSRMCRTCRRVARHTPARRAQHARYERERRLRLRMLDGRPS